MIFMQIPVGQLKNLAYLVYDEETFEGVLVDPAWDIDRILDIVETRRVKILYVVNTHAHFDHVRGNQEVSERTGARVAAHVSSRIRKDISLEDSASLNVGKLSIRVIHTPGHSPDSVCLLVDGKLITGDTLFVSECGRTDMPGGDPHALYDSLFSKLAALEGDVEVYPGHDYGERPSSTLGFERMFNYTLKPRSRAEFVRFMAEP